MPVRVVQHVLVERSGLLLLLAGVALPHSGFPGALDALTGIAVKGPCVLLCAAGVALVTSFASYNEIVCCILSMVDLAHWKLSSLQESVAHRT